MTLDELIDHKPLVLPFKTEDEWHALRAPRVGGSEVPALLGVSPFLSRWQLWHQKKGTLAPDDLSSNERVILGSELEAGIANAAHRILGRTLRKVRRYLAHPKIPGFGASLDYETSDGAGWVPVEIKLIAESTFYKDWVEGEDGRIPPPHILCQLQAQCSVAASKYGYVLALVGGYHLELVRVDAHPELIHRINTEVGRFWKSIEDGDEPDPNFATDLDAIQKVYRDIVPKSQIDAREDIELAALCADYAEANANRRKWEAAEATAKAAIIANETVRTAEVVLAPGAVIKSKVVERKDGPKRDTRINITRELEEAANV